MSEDSHTQAKIIVKYLNTLIREIENNPDISPWVIRQVLKTAKEKAEILADDLEDEENNHKVLSNSHAYFNCEHKQ